MDATNRFRTRAQFLRDCADILAPTLIKPDYDAAFAGIDDYFDAHQAEINQAFPQPFRSAASTELKAAVVSYMAARRANRLHAKEDE